MIVVQHKDQLGGNKYVDKVTVWKDASGDEQMMFWVSDAPPSPHGGDTSHDDGIADSFGKAGEIVRRSDDGRRIIREHRIFAKL